MLVHQRLQLDDELAYIFPSDSGLTCVAVSVNLETFRWLRKDFETRYAERIARHRVRYAADLSQLEA